MDEDANDFYTANAIPTELGGEYKHIRSKRVITPRLLDHLKGSS